MKLFHLSDLHIGKRVNEFSMIEDQKYILTQILYAADQEKPDGILISGDVYDRTIPTAEAVQVFDAFLTRLSEQKIPAFIISGNHDSAERLAFGSSLMGKSGIYFSKVCASEPVEKIPEQDALGTGLDLSFFHFYGRRRYVMLFRSVRRRCDLRRTLCGLRWSRPKSMRRSGMCFLHTSL